MKLLITFYRFIKRLILNTFNPTFKFVKNYTDLIYLRFYGVETELGYVTSKGVNLGDNFVIGAGSVVKNQ